MSTLFLSCCLILSGVSSFTHIIIYVTLNLTFQINLRPNLMIRWLVHGFLLVSNGNAWPNPTPIWGLVFRYLTSSYKSTCDFRLMPVLSDLNLAHSACARYRWACLHHGCILWVLLTRHGQACARRCQLSLSLRRRLVNISGYEI